MEITKRDLRYFSLAREASKSSTYKQHQLGCVTVYKRKHVLSVGWNVDKTHPAQKKYNKYRNLDGDNVEAKAHAEIMALSKIRYLDVDFSDVEVYVWRNLKDGSKALSRPCRACYRALIDLGIRTINYTIDNGYACEKIA